MGALKYIAVFLGGAGAGVLGVRTYYKHRYRNMAEQEIESVRYFYEKKRNEDRGIPETDIGEEEDPAEAQHRDYSKLVNNYTKPPLVHIPEIISRHKVPLIDPSELMHPTDDDPDDDGSEYIINPSINIPDPYVITEEEFSEECLKHDKLTVRYFIDDDTLCDDQEVIVDDVVGIIGEDAMADILDENVVYVRNERIGVDYEILRVPDSYSNVILGYNETSKKKDKPKKGMKPKDEGADK